MATLLASRNGKTGKFVLPDWAWPALGLVGGLLLVVVVHGTCFVDPTCD